MVGLALHELARGGHPVSSLPHYTVQAYNNTRFSKGGLALQGAARDPLVREDGHLFFSVLSSAALAVIAAVASRGDWRAVWLLGDRCGGVARRLESGVVAFSES